jgi:hypothetical protein
LWIGNGVTSAPDYAPAEGVTEVLTQNSILNFTQGFAANVIVLQSNVANLQAITNTITADFLTSNTVVLSSTSSGAITSFSANNATITYTLNQGNNVRTGLIRTAFSGPQSTVIYSEDYSETGTTDLVFSLSANSSAASLNYSTTTGTNLLYKIQPNN